MATLKGSFPTMHSVTEIFSETTFYSLCKDLNNLVAWSKEWQMLFSLDKCKIMHLGFNNPNADYFVDNVQMQRVNEERDLGVIMSTDLKWEKQCIAAAKKGNRVLGMIKRNFIDRSKETMHCTKAW